MSRKKLTIDKLFNSRLKELIDNRLKISQSEFANKIGISQGYLSMVLSKRRGPSSELIAGLFLNYSNYLPWLLTGEDVEILVDSKVHKPTFDDPKMNELCDSIYSILISRNSFAINTLDNFVKYLSQTFHVSDRLNSVEAEIQELKGKKPKKGKAA